MIRAGAGLGTALVRETRAPLRAQGGEGSRGKKIFKKCGLTLD
jgi:hypothetical protein